MGSGGVTYQTARAVLKGYEMRHYTEHTRQIQGLFRELDQMDDPIRIVDKRGVVSQEALTAIDSMAERLAKDVFVRDLDAEEEYRDLRAATSGKYYLSQQDRHDLTDFNSRNSMVKTTTDRGATSIDSLYQELASAYPHRFSGLTHPADQLREMNDVLRELRNSSIPLSAEMRKDTQISLSSDLMRHYYVWRNRERKGKK